MSKKLDMAIYGSYIKIGTDIFFNENNYENVMFKAILFEISVWECKGLYINHIRSSVISIGFLTNIKLSAIFP